MSAQLLYCAIRPTVMPFLKAFFAFSFFNSVLVGMRGALLIATILSIYHFCVAIQKALLRI
jgi:hypothetical protein